MRLLWVNYFFTCKDMRFGAFPFTKYKFTKKSAINNLI